jgi:hypothetical protein
LLARGELAEAERTIQTLQEAQAGCVGQSEIIAQWQQGQLLDRLSQSPSEKFGFMTKRFRQAA